MNKTFFVEMNLWGPLKKIKVMMIETDAAFLAVVYEGLESCLVTKV